MSSKDLTFYLEQSRLLGADVKRYWENGEFIFCVYHHKWKLSFVERGTDQEEVAGRVFQILSSFKQSYPELW